MRGPGYVSGMPTTLEALMILGVVFTQVGVAFIAIGSATWKGRAPQPGGVRDFATVWGNAAVIVGAIAGLIAGVGMLT